MHIRCKSCHTAVWLEIPETTDRAASVGCKTCGQEYRLTADRRPDRTGRKLAREARRLAESNGIDLPGAYSILLGAMTLEEVRRIRTGGAPAAELPPVAATPRAEPAGDAGRARLPYDPAFEHAVKEGLLTPQEAAQRGQRSSYAGIVASRHNLPLPVAFDVADNKLSLLVALRQSAKAGTAPIELAFEPPRGVPLRFGLLGSAALIALAVVFRPTIPVPVAEHADTTRVVQGGEVRTDADGRVVSVSGPDPRTVLASYCAADREQRFEAMGLVPPPTGGVGTRLGLLRRVGGSDVLLSIEIHENRALERWVAGGGVEPLVAGPAPSGAANGIRRLVPPAPAE